MVSQALADSIAGAIGGVGALLLTYPLKTIYTLQALSGTSEKQALSILDVIRRYKLRGLYTGIEPNVFDSAISNGVYFYLYARCKRAVIARRLRAERIMSESRTNGTDQQGAPHSAATSSKPSSSCSQDLSILDSLLVAAVAGECGVALTQRGKHSPRACTHPGHPGHAGARGHVAVVAASTVLHVALCISLSGMCAQKARCKRFQ